MPNRAFCGPPTEEGDAKFEAILRRTRHLEMSAPPAPAAPVDEARSRALTLFENYQVLGPNSTGQLYVSDGPYGAASLQLVYDPATRGTDHDMRTYSAMAKAQRRLQTFMADQHCKAKASGQPPPPDADLLHRGKRKLRQERPAGHRCGGPVCEGYCRMIVPATFARTVASGGGGAPPCLID